MLMFVTKTFDINTEDSMVLTMLHLFINFIFYVFFYFIV